MARQGILLVNLGSPDSPKTGDVRRYLREFLMDPKVLDVPWPVRFGIVHFAILPRRPKESAEAYRKIWTPEGSPLVVSTRKLKEAIAERFPGIAVEWAMRYQHPTIESAMLSLKRQDVARVVVFPLFPHYAMSSYESAVERVRAVARKISRWMELPVIWPYYDHPEYIEALVARSKPYLEKEHDHLLFSFHGVPERHLRKSDPTGSHCLASADCCSGDHPAHATCYRAQCLRTMEAFSARAGLAKDKYSFAFQSRLGKDPWLRPYADQTIREMPAKGIRRLLVICPAFISDCLETIEEIGMQAKKEFLNAGGESFELIPCLNEHPRWIDAMEALIDKVL